MTLSRRAYTCPDEAKELVHQYTDATIMKTTIYVRTNLEAVIAKSTMAKGASAKLTHEPFSVRG